MSRDEDQKEETPEMTDAEAINLAVQTDLEGEQGELQRKAREIVKSMPRSENSPLKALGAPIDYFKRYEDPDRNAIEDIDIAEAKREGDAKRAAAEQAAADPMSRIGRNNPASFTGPSGVYRDETGLHTGRFVTQADFDEGQRQIEEHKRRKMEAQQRANDVQKDIAARRDALLSKGYYDDGRGNLRQKKYNYAFGERRGNAAVSQFNQSRRTVRMDDIVAQSWEEAARQQAEQRARQLAEPSGIVQANRMAMEQNANEKKFGETLKASNDASLFEAMTAAYDDMKRKIGENGEVADGDIFNETRLAEKDDQGRDARWTYDAQNRVTGQNTERKRENTGRRFVNGFLDARVVKSLNDRLFANGQRDSKIMGVMVQQPVDANGRATGIPLFYVQRRLADGRMTADTGTLRDVYAFGVKSYAGRGDTDAEDRVINSPLGDVMGMRANRQFSEKMQIAQMREQGLNDRAKMANETKVNLAKAANALKQYGIDVSAQLKERGLDIQQQNADERSAHNQAVESQQAENEKGRNDRAKRANELKTKMAEMKSKGTIGGRPPTTHEYVEALRFANDLLNDEADRNAMREHAKRIEESLRQRGEKIPEPPPPGKTEVKTGDNGGGDGKRFKEGDVQEINGIKMKLLPSKKNPGKLTWQRV